MSDESNRPVIEVRGLRNAFGEHVIHDGLDLEVRRGEIMGVVGGSGTGKSVLMRSIIGLQTPLAGEVEVFGEPTAGLDPIGAAGFDQLILELRDALGLTVFLITHDLDTLYAICDRIAVLADRKVIAVGTIEELLALDHEWIQEYFKGPRGRAAAPRVREPAAGVDA